MKKIMIGLLVLSIMVLACFDGFSQQFEWGTARDIVKSVKGVPFSESDKGMLYQIEFGGYPTIQGYMFNEAGLSSIAVQVPQIILRDVQKMLLEAEGTPDVVESGMWVWEKEFTILALKKDIYGWVFLSARKE
jgi:hypothetical protein